jgi:hypothetical protein
MKKLRALFSKMRKLSFPLFQSKDRLLKDYGECQFYSLATQQGRLIVCSHLTGFSLAFVKYKGIPTYLILSRCCGAECLESMSRGGDKLGESVRCGFCGTPVINSKNGCSRNQIEQAIYTWMEIFYQDVLELQLAVANFLLSLDRFNQEFRQYVAKRLGMPNRLRTTSNPLSKI